MTMRPDPTFHASPKLAMEAPAENFAYTLLLSPDSSQPDALAVVDVKPGLADLQPSRPHGDDAEQGRRVPPFRLECLLVGAVAADRPCLPRAALPDHSRASAPRASTSSTRSRIRQRPRSTRSSSPRRSSARPATRARTRSIAAPRASTSARSAAAARTAPTVRPASSSWIARPSRCSAAGRSTAARRTSTTISGGTCRATTWCRASGRCRRSSRTASCPRTCCPTNTGIASTSGICAPAATCRRSTSARTTRWRWRCGPPTIPIKEYGFLGVVVDTTNLEGSIWTWWREGGKFHIEKTATIPAEPAPKEQLPPLLQGFGAVPPLVTDIDLSLDDRFLYVSCWGTGEMRQYDVSDPRKPKLAGSVHIGGIARRTPHPNGKAYRGRPADGRDQPRRQARLLDQLALLDLGRPVLSGRRAAAQVKADAGPGRRARTGQRLLGDLPRGLPGAPDPARRRRLLDRLVLLPVGVNLSGADWTPAGLWLAVVASGLYHGINPGMGWPLAVSAAADGAKSRALSGGAWLLWRSGICWRCSRSCCPLPLLAALARMAERDPDRRESPRHRLRHLPAVRRRHPRVLARIRPTGSALWSFAVAIAHGAGLMLVPIYLGLCRASDMDRGHEAAGALISRI